MHSQAEPGNEVKSLPPLTTHPHPGRLPSRSQALPGNAFLEAPPRFPATGVNKRKKQTELKWEEADTG